MTLVSFARFAKEEVVQAAYNLYRRGGASWEDLANEAKYQGFVNLKEKWFFGWWYIEKRLIMQERNSKSEARSGNSSN